MATKTPLNGLKGRRPDLPGDAVNRSVGVGVGVGLLRLSASLAMTMPLPPLAVTMKPALMTEMMARPSALAITWAARRHVIKLGSLGYNSYHRWRDERQPGPAGQSAISPNGLNI